jgi:biopolymer transport protein TolR
MSRKKKHIDFELNLIPFIDLLSTCICFLLMTAVWTQVGSMDAKQSVGGQPVSETEKKPTLVVRIENNGDLGIEVKDAKIQKLPAAFKVSAVSGKPNVQEMENLVQQYRNQEPTLVTALISPQSQSMLEDLIEVMDRFRKMGVNNLGVSPL